MKHALRAAAILLAVGLIARPVSALEADAFPLPEGTHSGSGYTAIEAGLDGMIYVGTTVYGGSAHLVRLDPATGKWDDLFSVHDITRDTGTGLDSQSKLHAKLLVDADGTVWAATKQGNEEFNMRPEYGENPTGFRGGHIFSFNPAAGTIRDHGIVKAQEGLMGGSIDRERRRLYYWGDPKSHLFMYDIATNAVRDLGVTMGKPRYTAIDPKGRVFGTGRPGIIWMYDPGADALYDLAVNTRGPGEFVNPYVFAVSADGSRLFGAAIKGEYVMDFDLASIDLNAKAPGANGTIACTHAGPLNKGDQHAGVVGVDGCFYFNSTQTLYKYDPAARAVHDLGLITIKGQPDFKPEHSQGACVTADGTLYMKFIYPYQVLRFDKLTTPAEGK